MPDVGTRFRRVLTRLQVVRDLAVPPVVDAEPVGTPVAVHVAGPGALITRACLHGSIGAGKCQRPGVKPVTDGQGLTGLAGTCATQ